MVKPCLFSDRGYSIRELGAAEALRRAVEEKPERGTVNSVNCFYNIGG
jgi:cyclic pyranopterin phosphate synthase